MTKDPKKANRRSAESKLSFEDALAKLEQVVQQLEDGRIGLTQALARYEEGVKLAEICPVVTHANEGVPIRASRELTRVEYPHRAVARERLRTIAELVQGNTDYRPAHVTPALIVGRSSRREDYPHVS